MKKARHRVFLVTILALQVGVSLLFFSPDGKAMQRGKLYIIGTGPSGPQMATLQALNTIKSMDAIVAPNMHAKVFSEYIGNKPVLFDPWRGFWDYNGKHFLKLGHEEMAKFRVRRFKLRDERVKIIKDLLNQGKNVGLLDMGNPCLFGPSHWYVEQFDSKDLTIIPGMGSEAAALAALGKSIIPAYNTRFVVQTAPVYLAAWDKILKDLRRYPAGMILYMALHNPEKVLAGLNEAYPADMPCAVVYWAGFPNRQRIVRGTLGDIQQKILNEKENYMGLLFVGRFLEGKPYEAAVKAQ